MELHHRRGQPDHVGLVRRGDPAAGETPGIRSVIAAEPPPANGAPRLGALAMPVLETVSMEIRRLAPVVFVFFGKARETFEFGGYTVPKGWAVLLGHRSSLIRPEIYSRPEEFDPSRFTAPRSEHKRHECAFVPNGAGPATGHKCAGYEFAPLFLQVFLAELCRGYDVTLQRPQDLERDWSRIPPEPRVRPRARARKKGRTGGSLMKPFPKRAFVPTVRTVLAVLVLAIAEA